MNSAANAPGLYFTATPGPAERSPLRSDVAGFIGRTKRGPAGVPVRVTGWREYLREFGGLRSDAVMTYSIRGYFENEGQVAHVIRLCHATAAAASAAWRIGTLDEQGAWEEGSISAFDYAGYLVEASSPGDWGNSINVTLRYRLRGSSGPPELDVAVTARDEPPELFTGLLLGAPPAGEDPPREGSDPLAAEIAARSRLIRLTPLGPRAQAGSSKPGPHSFVWELKLGRGTDGDEIGKPEYLEAAGRLGEEGEVALVAVPGLSDDLTAEDDQFEVLIAMIDQAEQSRDRLVLVDVKTEDRPSGNGGQAVERVKDTLEWAGALRTLLDRRSRAAAIYHPRLNVNDPLGGLRRPLREIPPSGHVAGVISRLDRQRGAHQTPANAPIFEAVDVARRFDRFEQARFNDSGVNLLRCFPGNGIQVWGGRTLNPDPQQRFIAHRRLIHRLVRAIRRVAEPLVFETNGPELWLTLVRSITTVLLEAWRAGSLKGARAEEAFRVTCDAQLNPPEEIELGRLHCEIEVAPAAPMEFILLRVSLSGEGKLEVFES
ncbi:MAG TPA: phage tail sheath subtilisin-like domain-containing protein [Blastocatellia bacterium]|nr:phage tail sheath subtilisin-like domain-containing protein [Blastocatellia bacterium]